MAERVTNSFPDPDTTDFSSSERNLSPEVGLLRTLSAPVTLQWEVTPFCNEQCVHCYNHWRGLKGREKLIVGSETLAFYDHASREILRSKVFHVTVTGGEPLAVLRRVYPYLMRLKEGGVGISFNTNLTMLTKDKAEMLRELGVRSILTSLISGNSALNDQLANRVNTQRDVVRGIALALEEGFWVAVNMVVTKKNIAEVYSTAEFARSLGVNAFSATKASTPTNSPDFSGYSLSRDEFKCMVDELLRVERDLGMHVDSLEFYPMCFFDTQESRDFAGNRICNAGKTACTVGFDGKVRPCSHAEQVYGTVLEENGLQQAWINLQPWRTTEYIPNECDGCSLRSWCRGGCRTEAFAASRSLKAPDPYCDFSHPVLPKTSARPIEVDFSAKYQFHSGVRGRREDFGGILFVTPVRWVGVTPNLYEFYLSRLEDGFYLSELAEALGMEDASGVKRTAEMLIQKTIMLRGGENK